MALVNPGKPLLVKKELTSASRNLNNVNVQPLQIP